MEIAKIVSQYKIRITDKLIYDCMDSTIIPITIFIVTYTYCYLSLLLTIAIIINIIIMLLSLLLILLLLSYNSSIFSTISLFFPIYQAVLP